MPSEDLSYRTIVDVLPLDQPALVAGVLNARQELIRDELLANTWG